VKTSHAVVSVPEAAVATITGPMAVSVVLVTVVTPARVVKHAVAQARLCRKTCVWKLRRMRVEAANHI
jgi:hypothetical protein